MKSLLKIIAILLVMVCGSTQADNYHTCEFTDWELSYISSDAVIEKRSCIICNSTETRTLDIIQASNFNELKALIENGANNILIADDIVMTETVYISDEVCLFSSSNRTIIRDPSFLGDMFVIGESPEGQNPILKGKKASLTLKSSNYTTLSIDGNKSDITDDVKGTAFFITNSATLNVHNGISIINHRKLGNERLSSDTSYHFSYPDRVGGAAVIIASGTFNMYGGSISDCEVNSSDVSSCGGAIYNHSTFNMYGGSIENCTAGRGGAIYNYRTLKLIAGKIESNHAHEYGGAIYQADSQYSSCVIGSTESNDQMIFDSNTSKLSGGAIFSTHQSSTAVLGNTLFEANKSLASNGGAINVAGALVINNASFKNNIAASKGGAIYAYYSKSQYTTRLIEIKSGVFSGNEASRGGAIAFAMSGDVQDKGAIGYIGDVTFTDNRAFMTEEASPTFIDNVDREGVTKTENGNGGALHVAENSVVTVSEKASFVKNKAEGKGGAIYVTSSSQVIISGTPKHPISFIENTSGENGGAVYLYTTAKINISYASFIRNSSASLEYGGGALYLTGATAVIDHTIMEENSAYRGGAISLYSAASLTANDLTLINNSASNRGGAGYFSGANVNATNISVISNTSGDTGGAFGIYSESTAVFTNMLAENNTSSKNGGCIYISGSSVTVQTDENARYFFKNNASLEGNGGVIAAHSDASITLYGIKAIDNFAENGNGGAVYIYNSGATLGDDEHTEPNVFIGNKAEKGGAIYVGTASGETSTLNAHTIYAEGNSASGGGGAIYITSNNSESISTASISSLVLDDNHADGNGGALYIYTSARFTVGSLTAENNSCDGYGGVMYVSQKAYVTVGSINAKNNVSSQGGAIYLTTKGTEVALLGGNIESNADYYSIYSNSANAVLKILKNSLTYPDGSIGGVSGFEITEIEEVEA